MDNPVRRVSDDAGWVSVSVVAQFKSGKERGKPSRWATRFLCNRPPDGYVWSTAVVAAAEVRLGLRSASWVMTRAPWSWRTWLTKGLTHCRAAAVSAPCSSRAMAQKGVGVVEVQALNRVGKAVGGQLPNTDGPSAMAGRHSAWARPRTRASQ